MAGRLFEYAGINPFTIDQVKFTERSKPELGHWFTYATNEQNSFVFVNQNKELFNGLKEPKQTDITVIHSITNTLTNDPIGWLPGDLHTDCRKRSLKTILSRYRFWHWG
jgi:hypothetical protein